jgi:hypothetical protein
MNEKTKAALASYARSAVGALVAVYSTGTMDPMNYVKGAVANKEVVAAAAFAVNAQQKAMQEKKNVDSPTLELVTILQAEQQVVAGINYRLKLKVMLNGKEKPAEAIVWWQAWRKPNPYQLTSWTWM